MSTHTREIKISDVGPITEFAFRVPERGGVVVLKGENGKGKTRALEAIESLTTGRSAKAVEHRDGAVKGEVHAFGAKLSVSRRVTSAGELEVTSLEGRFSVLDLVDPKLKEADAADAKRIKALVQLAGDPEANPALFYPLVGGQEAFTEYVSTGAVDSADLVTMAARVKRDLEKAARTLEEEATKENIAAESDRKAAEGIDLTATDDARKLHEDLELAIGEESKLKEQARNAIAAELRAKGAAESLQAAESNNKALSVALAKANVELAAQEISDAQLRVADLQKHLAQAKVALFEAETKHEAALTAQQQAEAHESTIAQWRATLAAELPPKVTDGQLAAATEDVEAAREAVDQGAIIRQAKLRIAQAGNHAQEAAALRTKADKLREAARGTDTILSEVVQRLGCPLKVSHGRLVTQTDRGQELFSDLSRGEQWKVALDIAIDAVGPQGVLVIDQEGWEGLDPINRELIANHVEGTGVVIITAECDLGELRAETIAAADETALRTTKGLTQENLVHTLVIETAKNDINDGWGDDEAIEWAVALGVDVKKLQAEAKAGLTLQTSGAKKKGKKR